MALVRLRPGHPYSSHSRSGIVFGVAAIEVPDDEMTDEIRNDPVLIVEDDSVQETSSAEATEVEQPQN